MNSRSVAQRDLRASRAWPSWLTKWVASPAKRVLEAIGRSRANGAQARQLGVEMRSSRRSPNNSRRFVYVFHQFLGTGGERNVGGIYSHVENYNRIAGFRPVVVGLSTSSKPSRKGRRLFLARRMSRGPLLVQYAVAILFSFRFIAKIRRRRVILIERPELAAVLWPRRASYLFTIHGVGFPGPRRRFDLHRWVYEAIERLAIRRSYRTFIVEPARQEAFSKRGFTQTVFSPTAFSADNFQWVPLPDFTRLRIGYAGRCGPEKRLHLFGPILARVAQRIPVELVHAGTAEESDFHLPSGADVRFKPLGVLSLEQMRQFYGACHLTMLTSLFEGYPMQLVEAAACGRPFVAPDHPGIVNLSRAIGGGEVVAFHSPAFIEEMADKIVAVFERLRTDESFATDIVARAQAFEVQSVFSQYKAALEDLSGQPGASSALRSAM